MAGQVRAEKDRTGQGLAFAFFCALLCQTTQEMAETESLALYDPEHQCAACDEINYRFF